MKRIRRWLVERLLPVWARAELLAENRRLEEEIRRLNQELERKDAYIDGLTVGIRAQRKIVINTQEVRK